MGADRKLVARAALKMPDAKVLGCVVIKLGTIDEIVGYDEDDSPEYETRKVYMSAGVDYDKVLRYNPNSGYCDPNASSTQCITTENRFANSGYSELLKEMNDFKKFLFFRFDGKSSFPFGSKNWKPVYDFYNGSIYSADERCYSSHQVIFGFNWSVSAENIRLKYTFPGIVTFPVNTSKITEYYDLAMSKYGKTNKYYTADSWSRYLNALAAAENIVNNGVNLYIFEHSEFDARPENIADPQAEIYNVWTELRDAINALVPLPTSITYVNNVSGATVSGPATATPGNNISVTLRLEDSHSKSPNAGVNIKYEDGTTKNFTSGTRNGNTLTITLPLEGFNPTITPINIAKNTYTVTVPTSGTGFTASKTGTVTHGENYTFTVTLSDGYTQTLPVVKAGSVTLGATSQGNNTYSYTITGVKADTSVSINGVTVNTYNVGYSLGSGASMASGTATSIKHFGEATIKLTVDAAHSQNAPDPSVSNGTITYVSKDEATNTYTYTLKDVTANTTVTVGNIKKNIYTVNIPEGEGYSLDRKSMNIEHGDNFDFTVTLDAAHSQTPPRTFLAGNELSYTKVGENGYKFNTGAVYAHGDVTISNIKINTYSIELPADTDAFKAADKDGFNSTSIIHGNDYTFSVISIGGRAFEYCTGLTSITIPDSVTNIGDKAFGYYYEESTDEDKKLPNFTIYGYRNTAAETYANENDLTFINLDAVDCDHRSTEERGEIPATCTENGKRAGVFCVVCGTYISGGEESPALGHTDTDNDGNCDRCGEKTGEPVNPPEPTDPSENCSCACHKKGIINFFYKIILFFQKIFRKNKVCKCGVYHY